ncbi:testis-expressed protein 33 isoform X3 [Polypterus senegalus]|uniref:testis-expressed protein 33 isoform X3 n=1 Tax=Polypterus senegalus TaxID=55291 RepID=UPI001965620D|nr:testis-expressed protein 33 isoform X3 [Polypterus senegalus]
MKMNEAEVNDGRVASSRSHGSHETPLRAFMESLAQPSLKPSQAGPAADVSCDLGSPYQALGHSLRANTFPGAPQPGQSLFNDSFTPDVPAKSCRNPQVWFGRRTDDLGRWTEKNILHSRLKKALGEAQKSPGKT